MVGTVLCDPPVARILTLAPLSVQWISMEKGAPHVFACLCVCVCVFFEGNLFEVHLKGN